MGVGLVLRPCSIHWSGERTHLHAAQGHRHTARAPGGKQRRLFTGTQHMQPKQQRIRQGRKRDFYLFSPSSPGTSKPWPFVLRGSGSEGLSRAHGPGLRTRLRVALLGRQHRIPLGCAASGLGARPTARPWLPANGVSPRPGRCLKGCLPRPGGFAGAGHSFSSSDSGCSCNLPARSGGKQAGRSSSWLVTTKSSQIKEKGRGPLAAAMRMRRLKSIHILCCSLWLRDKDSKCLPRASGS